MRFWISTWSAWSLARVHRGEVVGRHPVRAQRRREPVRRRDRVLDREVDPDPADRRHRVRGVADAQHARRRPALEPVARWISQNPAWRRTNSRKSTAASAR